MEQRRLKAVRLFAQEQSDSDIARHLNITRQSVGRWRIQWRKGGIKALKSKGPAGVKPRITPAQTEQVLAALTAGPLAAGHHTDVRTLPRVATLVQQLTGKRYHSGHCRHLLRRLGFSCQRPTRRALSGMKRRLLAGSVPNGRRLKKRPGGKAEPSSLSTKAA